MDASETARPFVPRDVFRLLVRLEAQKTHDVDTEALERKFRVPPGYSKDETVEQRERKALNTTPGPGAYEVSPSWTEDAVRNSSVFASRADRDPFQLKSLKELVTPGRQYRRTESAAKHGVNMGSYLDIPPALGSFTQADRGMILPTSPPPPRRRQDNDEKRDAGVHSGGLSFGRAPRATQSSSSSRIQLGPGQYEVRRLWDPSNRVERAMVTDSPTPAVFGASQERREVVWSPARGLPTNAIPEAWNTSEHYVKHKSRVLLERKRNKEKREKFSLLSHSRSSSTLDRTKQTSHEAPLDPFEWLRRLPLGEQRTIALASKHGLSEFVRTLTPLTSSEVSLEPHEPLDTPSAATTQEPDKLHNRTAVVEDDDFFSSRTMNLRVGEIRRDKRINVSCRLQGGLVVTVKMYSAKRVHQLKTALVGKQARFKNEDQFDLYLANGKPLTRMEDTLQDAGLVDRSLVQVVSK